MCDNFDQFHGFKTYKAVEIRFPWMIETSPNKDQMSFHAPFAQAYSEPPGFSTKYLAVLFRQTSLIKIIIQLS